MSLFHSAALAGASGQGGVSAQYQIARSLRFNSADSAYLSRTPASAGNRKTWTWSGWVKLCSLANGGFFSVNNGSGGGDYVCLQFAGDGRIRFELYTAPDFYSFYSIPVYRDTGAWYHFVISCDTPNANVADRFAFYANGLRQSTDTISITQNWSTPVNASGLVHFLGNFYAGSRQLSGYLADIHFIDGQALTPSSFGETDATTGEWIPKAYTGTYGTNGFKLDFADNSAATAAALGKDTSGNGNNWTPTNLSVTAGTGNDSLVDTPTSYGTDTGVGGEVRGNYATLNPLQNTGNTLSNGNLDVSIASTNWTGSTVAMTTGKWYTEFTVGSTGTIQMFGVCNADFYGTGGNAPWITAGAKEVTYYVSDGRVYVDGVHTGATSGATAGDIISFAFDADARSVAIRKNNTLLTTKTITASAAGYIFYVSSGGGSCTATLNYGARSFAYTAPSGFKALCDTNLPAPTIARPNTAMDVKLYTGNGSTQTISGLGFSPDLVWGKVRSTTGDHHLVDSVRGDASGTTNKTLFTTSTEGDYPGLDRLFNFSSTGFTAGGVLNTDTATYVAWCWDAGSSTVTNTAGTISSQVRANASAGFSVVTYTGTGANATVGHGLGAAPQMIIVKSRNDTYGWKVYHSSIGNGNSLVLNSTAASTSDSAAWNSTSPTSSVFSIGNGTTNASSSTTYVAYCFAPVAGYSAFGSYTGNGNADGPFVYTGFRPRWVMVKRTDVAGNSWAIMDTARSGYNLANAVLWPNLADAETASDFLDSLSNGFKLRATSNNWNASAGTYIYAAFAEFPFQYARAR